MTKLTNPDLNCDSSLEKIHDTPVYLSGDATLEHVEKGQGITEMNGDTKALPNDEEINQPIS